MPSAVPNSPSQGSLAAAAEQARSLEELARLQGAPLRDSSRPSCPGRASGGVAEPRRGRGTAWRRRATRRQSASPVSAQLGERAGEQVVAGRARRTRRRRPPRQPRGRGGSRAPSMRSSCTSVAMWMSSTATPAASGGGPVGEATTRKTSIGRRRLPPAASASAPTAATVPGWLPHGVLQAHPRARRGSPRAPALP